MSSFVELVADLAIGALDALEVRRHRRRTSRGGCRPEPGHPGARHPYDCSGLVEEARRR